MGNSQMGNIEVHLFAAARSAVGHRTVTASGKTLAEVVASLIADYPAFAAVEPRCSYLVNGLAARGDLDLINLAAGARVDVLPPFAGG
ncbi:MAG: molybdopterin synthase sulfur carrier subunit [Actinobacteria bacterium]|nr:MAG: molybdopterin synthase sulfur carrier subunit [Actinomycetota bacterium]